MKRQTICKFVQSLNGNGDISTINFVHETKTQNGEIKHPPVYAVNLVTSGSATFFTCNKEYHLNKGDLFFMFPGSEYSIKSIENFSYSYVSFLGKRTQKIMDSLNINRQNPVLNGYLSLDEFWYNALLTSTENTLDLICESVLLYTFASIKKKIAPPKEVKSKSIEIINAVKLYIDERFTNHELSLELISKAFSYNPKYLSNLFSNVQGEGIKEYVVKKRIAYAEQLFSQGFTSVKDISFMCGFNDQLYFSKVFKKTTGISPKEYREK